MTYYRDLYPKGEASESGVVLAVQPESFEFREETEDEQEIETLKKAFRYTAPFLGPLIPGVGPLLPLVPLLPAVKKAVETAIETGKKIVQTGVPIVKSLLDDDQKSAPQKPAAPVMQFEKVCWIQNVLNKTFGENLATDGIYGPLTREAVRRFQSKAGISGDGVVGVKTETAMIQNTLNEIRKASLVAVNGIMDERLRSEIRRFQSEKGLTADGIVGPRTRVAMVAALGGTCLLPRIPPGCNKVVYEQLMAQCRDQALAAFVRCGAKFGIGEAKIIVATLPALAQLVGAAAAENPLAIALAVVKLIGPAIQDGKTKAAFTTCCVNIVRNYKSCKAGAAQTANCR